MLAAVPLGAESASGSLGTDLSGDDRGRSGGDRLAQASPAQDLSGLSLEQLGSIVVTSVSRRRERLADVSSSI